MYPSVDNPSILQDLLSRKEFNQLKDKWRAEKERNDMQLDLHGHLQYHSHQLFVQNFINPSTPYRSLLMKHSTGSGKTIGGIGIAMEFVKYFKESSVFIIAFDGAKKAFQNDLLRFPKFGFISHSELRTWNDLREKIKTDDSYAEAEREMSLRMRRRLTNRKNNGFFKFMGYKSLFNRLFYADGSGPDHEFASEFKNSLIICDEIHNVYNSADRNNWGLALQYIIDNVPGVRTVFMSATPVNNHPAEIVDLANLMLLADQRIDRSDIFRGNEIIPGKEGVIRKLFRGRVSYLMEKDNRFFPERIFQGESIKGIPYLKFIRCPLNKVQRQIYNNEPTHEGKYILDFVLPSPSGPVYTVHGLKKIMVASEQWKTENGIRYSDKQVSGSFLHASNLENVSPKYAKMLKTVKSLIRGKSGKIMIYHSYVHMSGVMFIREVLISNGFIEYGMGVHENTICALCGKLKKEHTDEKFVPARFIVAHGGIDKSLINKNIDMFNHSSNTKGEKCMILLGSRMIKESYDLKAIRHMMIMDRPDNIPTMIQILGRAVRKNSHALLPMKMRQVYVYIYTSGGPDITHDEVKYMEKVNDYKTIQQIERILHIDAIDSFANFATIQKGLDDTLGDLPYKPATLKKLPINTSTFEYFREQEMRIVTYIIKRLFVRTHVWTFDDLEKAVKAPPFDVEIDTRQISTHSIVVALTKLTKRSILRSQESTAESIFSTSKKITMLDGTVCQIRQMGKFYILVPDGQDIVRTDQPFRKYIDVRPTVIKVTDYLHALPSGVDYNKKLAQFKAKYEKCAIEKMEGAICENGTKFHITLAESCIEYTFGFLTTGIKKSDHAFMLKMLYYYDALNLIVFACTVPDGVFRLYKEFLSSRDTKMSKNDVNIHHTMNAIVHNITTHSCEWCPHITKERFNRLVKQKSPPKKLRSADLPIGHYMSEVPRFYHPSGWYEHELHTEKEWVENPIIIGYNVKNKTGMHMKFKLRAPINEVKHRSDRRKIEKGSICITRSKPELLAICKKLNIDVQSGTSIALCNLIKTRLLHLELAERAKGSNIKYLYLHFE